MTLQVIKVTKQGLTWANMSELNGLFNGLNIIKLPTIKMLNMSRIINILVYNCFIISIKI